MKLEKGVKLIVVGLQEMQFWDEFSYVGWCLLAMLCHVGCKARFEEAMQGKARAVSRFFLG